MSSSEQQVRVFSTARTLTVRSGVETKALVQAQNVVETLYAADDVEATLTEMEFRNSHGVWTRSYGDFSLYVSGAAIATEAGELWQGEVRAFLSQIDETAARKQAEEMFSLPCTRYKGGQS